MAPKDLHTRYVRLSGLARKNGLIPMHHELYAFYIKTIPFSSNWCECVFTNFRLRWTSSITWSRQSRQHTQIASLIELRNISDSVHTFTVRRKYPTHINWMKIDKDCFFSILARISFWSGVPLKSSQVQSKIMPVNRVCKNSAAYNSLLFCRRKAWSLQSTHRRTWNCRRRHFPWAQTNQMDNEIVLHARGGHILENQYSQILVAVSCYQASSEAQYEELF